MAEAIQEGCVDGTSVTLLRDRRDSAIMRVCCDDQSTVIMKFWARRGWRAVLRGWSRTTPSWREWTALHQLWARHVPIARPLARFSIDCQSGRFSEALVIEDLGIVQTAHHELKEAIARGDRALASLIEDDVVALTARIVRAGVLDPDHSVVNMLCLPGGQLRRIDFELARLVSATSRRPALYSQMIARLVGSFVFTVQPDLERAAQFSMRLAEELSPPLRVLQSAQSMIDAELERQRTSKGIDFRLTVDW